MHTVRFSLVETEPCPLSSPILITTQSQAWDYSTLVDVLLDVELEMPVKMLST